MADLNEGAFYGRLTEDAKKETYGEGKVRVDFCVCNNIYINGKDYPNFFHLSMFGSHAENLYPYLKKGQAVNVVYYMKQDRWEKDGKQYSKITPVVQKCHLEGKSKKGNAESNEAAPEETFEVEPSSETPADGSIF